MPTPMTMDEAMAVTMVSWMPLAAMKPRRVATVSASGTREAIVSRRRR